MEFGNKKNRTLGCTFLQENKIVNDLNLFFDKNTIRIFQEYKYMRKAFHPFTSHYVILSFQQKEKHH